MFNNVYIYFLFDSFDRHLSEFNSNIIFLHLIRPNCGLTTESAAVTTICASVVHAKSLYITVLTQVCVFVCVGG